MRSIRSDIEVLRSKAAECEHAAELAIDNDARVTCLKRAQLYRELVSEAELTIRRSQFEELRAK
jgi:hypothetical protein